MSRAYLSDAQLVKPKIFSIIKQVFIMAAIVGVISYWQSRHVPSGRAPQFSVQDLDGTAREFPSFSVPKVTLIYFFAPWCGVCRLSMGNLNSIQAWFPEISVQAVALDYETPMEVQKFVADVGVGIPVSIGSDNVRDLWQISAYPTYVVIGRDGNIHGSSVGYSSQFGMILRVMWTKIFD